MPSVSATAKIMTVGDSAVFVEFGDKIDTETNQRVIDLAHQIDSFNWPEVVETVPTYRSVAVYFNPMRISQLELTSRIRNLLSLSESFVARTPKLVRIPVVYGGEFGPDLDFVAEHNGIGYEEVVRLHTLCPFRVFMLGFAPGFAYLGEIPERIRAPRLPEPRLKVPAGSVGIAGSQTGVYPIEIPGGWRIIGRTPLELFNPQHPARFLYEAGDRVQFYAIGKEEFRASIQNATRNRL
jgi:inhibitor of KinA